MDLGKRSAAAAGGSNSNSLVPDVDIVDYLQAMRLGEAASSQHLQQRYAAAPASPRVQLAVPSQALWPVTRRSVHPLAHQLERARQLWPKPPPPLPPPQQQQQQQRYPWLESSSSGGYGSGIAAASYNDHPQHAGLAAGAAASARNYYPMVLPRASPCTLSASPSQYEPVAAPCLPVPTSPWIGSSNTSQQCCPAGTPYHQLADGSSLLNTLRNNRNQAALSSHWSTSPAIRRLHTMEEIRSKLLLGPMEVRTVLFPETSECVVCLLGEGEEAIRLSVLAGVKGNVHKIMDSTEGHKVFVALLHCCQGRFYELQGIVEAAVVANSKGSLLRSAKQTHGETCTKELITAVAQYPNLCAMIIDCFLREKIMDHVKGDELLRHCFTTMPFMDCFIMIQHAMAKFDKLMSSSFGSRCLAECFANARGLQLHLLERHVMSHANEMARGQYSNYFLQRVLEECGSESSRQLVAGILMKDVVSLSHDQFGSYVLEACFLRSSPATMSASTHRMLSTFRALDDDELGDLVKGDYSNYVLSKLLDAGRVEYPRETVELARRVEGLPSQVLEDMHAGQVMRAVKRLFRSHLRRPF